MNIIFTIDGARAFMDMDANVTDESIFYKVPETKKYSYGLLTNEATEDGSLLLFCQKEKDGYGVLALTVTIKGTEYSALDFREMNLQAFLKLFDIKEATDA